MTFTDAPTLANARVRLEQLSTAHERDLAEAVVHDELWRVWYTTIASPDAMAADIEDRLEKQRAGLVAPWAIIDPGSGKAVGVTTYMNIAESDGGLEIGSTWLGKPWQRSGINAAAKLLLLKRAFEDLGCRRVAFRAHWHNHQSRGAIERLGAKPEGVLRSHKVMPDGHVRDTVVYSIIEQEWPVVRRGLEFRLAA